MAEINFGVAVAAGVQSGSGIANINPTIAALSGALAIADGIILGDAGSGIGGTGIDFSTRRESRDQADVPFSFTSQAATFLRRSVDSFTIAVQLKGVGTLALAGLAASPVVDADLDLSVNYPGLDALMRGAGWVGAADATAVDAYVYTPEDANPFTAKVWSGQGGNSVATVIYDCVVNSLSIAFTPGDVAIATFDITGTISSVTGGVAVPTFDFQHVAAISAPALVSAGHNFGIGAVLRDFESLTVTVSQEVEESKSSNSTTGLRSRQSQRRITVDAVILADSGDDDYEETALNATVAPTDDLIFFLGAAVAPGGEVKGVQITISNPMIESISEAKVGGAKARALSMRATASTDGGEAELRFI